MRLAVVGSGMIVRDFLQVAADVPGLELAAIVGRASSRATLEDLAGRYAIPSVHVDYVECLADPGVDTVWVALPNALHADYSRRALLAERFRQVLTPPERVTESADGTKKYLFRTQQGAYIESAYIPDGDRATLCVSSQAGCRMCCQAAVMPHSAV